MTERRKMPATPRRDFLRFSTAGIGATALLGLLARDGLLGTAAASESSIAAGRMPMLRAKRAVQICLVGGLSHLDSFDYKPELSQFHGKSLQTDQQPDVFFGQVGLIRKSDWEFRRRGSSGLWVSELFPHLARQADLMTVIRSMVSESANHTPALFFANSGFQFNGFPSLGSWLAYGLGCETDNLPAYVVLPDGRGGPNGGASNWTSGFLPAEHQGVEFAGGDQPVRDLHAAEPVPGDVEADSLGLLRHINSRDAAQWGAEDAVRARVRSYELAAKMQLAIPEVADLASETAAMHAMYGIDLPQTAECGRRCLLARRLLERGVRFVQVFSGGPVAGSPRASWDAHEDVIENHSIEAGRIDRPVAGLLADLHQRGMLDDTLVLFTTEFGRTPFAQSSANEIGKGRDHNRYGFSCWMAGAGLKPGITYGETDEIGWKVVENPVSWHDFHATILDLFGIDHTRLTYYHNGIHRRLTNVHGEVIRDILT
ncbi:MAG: DUF1501 domain-containing protein [Pirellulales bacterium]